MVKNNRYKTRTTTNILTRSSIIPFSTEILFALFMLALVLIMSPGKASAATINVAAGTTSSTNGDSICQLDEALGNLGSGFRTYTDCVEVGAYGTNNTINLPVGTIVGPGSGLSTPDNHDLTITGQGMGQSILQDARLYLSGGSGMDNVVLKDFTIKNGSIAVQSLDSFFAEGIEIEGQNSAEEIGLNINNVGNATIKDSHIHDFLDSSGSGFGVGIYYANGLSSDATLSVDSVTISHASNGMLIMGGSGSGNNGSLDASIKNSTFTDIGIPVGSLGFTGALLVGANGTSASTYHTVNYTTTNNTFSNSLSNTQSNAIYERIESWGHVNHTAQNDLYAIGNETGSSNYFRYTGSGDGVFSATSLGGNLSSDNSLASYLTQGSDKHNQTTLASFLGDLAHNGGSVPTQALLAGSPAINAGTSVAGMTTDARGAARPQGSAFDVGAYELAFDSGNNGGGNNGGGNSSSGTISVTKPGGGTSQVTGTPTIEARPTFSGVTTPNSTVTVTVHSDPLSCSTTSDAQGNWSCTLDKDLEPGQHTVNILVTKPDSSTESFGPYTVNVLGDSTTAITNKTPLASTGTFLATGSLLAAAIIGASVYLQKKTKRISKLYKAVVSR